MICGRREKVRQGEDVGSGRVGNLGGFGDLGDRDMPNIPEIGRFELQGDFKKKLGNTGNPENSKIRENGENHFMAKIIRTYWHP